MQKSKEQKTYFKKHLATFFETLAFGCLEMRKNGRTLTLKWA
jgi:hypothetical protein